MLSNRRPPNIQAAFPFTHVTLRLQKPSERKMHQTAWRADSLTPEIWHTIFHTKYTTVRTAILTPIMVAFMFVALRLAGPRTLTQSTLLNKYAHMFYVCANGRAAPDATATSRNPWPWAGHALNQHTHMQWTPPTTTTRHVCHTDCTLFCGTQGQWAAALAACPDTERTAQHSTVQLQL